MGAIMEAGAALLASEWSPHVPSSRDVNRPGSSCRLLLGHVWKQGGSGSWFSFSRVLSSPHRCVVGEQSIPAGKLRI